MAAPARGGGRAAGRARSRGRRSAPGRPPRLPSLRPKAAWPRLGPGCARQALGSRGRGAGRSRSRPKGSDQLVLEEAGPETCESAEKGCAGPGAGDRAAPRRSLPFGLGCALGLQFARHHPNSLLDREEQKSMERFHFVSVGWIFILTLGWH